MCSIKTAHCGGRTPHRGYLRGSNLPPSHSSISSILSLLLFLFLLSDWPVGLSIIVLKSELTWALTCTTSNFPPSLIFLSFRLPLTGLTIFLSAVFGSSSSLCSSAVLFSAPAVIFSASLAFSVFLLRVFVFFRICLLFSLCLYRLLCIFLFFRLFLSVPFLASIFSLFFVCVFHLPCVAVPAFCPFCVVFVSCFIFFFRAISGCPCCSAYSSCCAPLLSPCSTPLGHFGCVGSRKRGSAALPCPPHLQLLSAAWAAESRAQLLALLPALYQNTVLPTSVHLHPPRLPVPSLPDPADFHAQPQGGRSLVRLPDIVPHQLRALLSYLVGVTPLP